MSTTKKGNAHELAVFDQLKEILKRGDLGLAPDSARIFRQKSYFSAKREADLVVDISIEMHLKGMESPSIIWVFECKDYASSLGVAEVEEFHAKLQQIGENNTKGTFAITGTIQLSALKYAKNMGIGVVRLKEGKLAFVTGLAAATDFTKDFWVDKPKINWAEFTSAITDPDHSCARDFYGTQDGYSFSGWSALLTHVLKK